MKAVILAAGVGARLAPLTNDRPKPMVLLGGVPLLFRTLDRLAEVGITGDDVIVVTGYRAEVVKDALRAAGRRARLVWNEQYATWNNFQSLLVAREAVGGDGLVQIDGDIVFDGKLLPRVLGAPGPAVLAVDLRPHLDPETMKVEASGANHRIAAISKQLDPRAAIGEYIGVTRLDAEVAPLVFDDLARFAAEGLTHEYYEHAYHRLAQRGLGPFRAIDVHDCQAAEIDTVDDLRAAEALVAGQG